MAVATAVKIRTGRGESEPVATRRSGEDPHFFAVLLGLLHEARFEAARRIGGEMRARGVDAAVCDFLEDDLIEAADALADLEAYFQEVVESLDRPAPSPGALSERAGDVTPLDRADHLHLVLTNLRRRLLQVAGRLAAAPPRRLGPEPAAYQRPPR